MHLLYVDDEATARKKFPLIISQLDPDYNVTVVASGEKALALPNLSTVDVAFLDIEMPGMNGIALAEKLHKLQPQLKIVFLTAYNNYAAEAFAVEANGYLLKPYSEEDVALILRKLLPANYQHTEHKVFISLMPWFDLYLDGEVMIFGRSKLKEMLAYLIFLDGKSVSTEQLTRTIWPGKPVDDASLALCRNTFKRLKDRLDAVNIGYILATEHYMRFSVPSTYHTDVEKLLAGDKETLAEYDGRFLENYLWAQDKAAALKQEVARLKRKRGKK